MIDASEFHTLYSLLSNENEKIERILEQFSKIKPSLQELELGELLVTLNNCGCLNKAQEFVSCLILLFGFYYSVQDVNPFWLHILSLLDTVLSDVHTNYIYKKILNRSVREELADVPAILLASDEHTSMGILDKCRKEIHSRYHAQSIPLCLYVGAPYPLPLTKQSADSIYVQYKNNQLNLYGMGDSLLTLQHRDYVFTPLPCDVRFFLQCCLVFTILSAIGLQFHARSYT